MKYKALIFDVDGVLVESEKPRFKFLQHISAKNGMNLPDTYFFQMIGKTTPVFFKEILGTHILNNTICKIIDEYKHVFKKNITRYIEPISETVDFIKQYSGSSKLVIATMNTRNKTQNLLQFLGINDEVDCYVSRDDVQFQKPNPEVYIQASQRIGINVKECAVIEDSITGVHAGIDAKMDCYVFLNSYNNKEQFIDYAIKGFIRTNEDLKAIALP